MLIICGLCGRQFCISLALGRQWFDLLPLSRIFRNQLWYLVPCCHFDFWERLLKICWQVKELKCGTFWKTSRHLIQKQKAVFQLLRWPYWHIQSNTPTIWKLQVKLHLLTQLLPVTLTFIPLHSSLLNHHIELEYIHYSIFCSEAANTRSLFQKSRSARTLL